MMLDRLRWQSLCAPYGTHFAECACLPAREEGVLGSGTHDFTSAMYDIAAEAIPLFELRASGGDTILRLNVGYYEDLYEPLYNERYGSGGQNRTKDRVHPPSLRYSKNVNLICRHLELQLPHNHALSARSIHRKSLAAMTVYV